MYIVGATIAAHYGTLTIALTATAVASTVWLVGHLRRERRRALERRRWAREDRARAVDRRRVADQVRSTVEELQPAVRAKYPDAVRRREWVSAPQPRVLTPDLDDLADDAAAVADAGTLTYDAAVWER